LARLRQPNGNPFDRSSNHFCTECHDIETYQEIAMLDALDQVPWDQLEHAYGAASDVPTHIRALASPDSNVRYQAYDQLWSSIIHQGTVYSATAYAVPFLIELLETPDVPEKPVLLTLLTHLACGNSYLYAHQDLLE
jgi:hypothetical protein